MNAICVQDGCPDILPKMCIFCGTCVTNCPSGAKRARNDVEQIKKMMGSGKKTFVSLAPSFPAEFCGCTGGQLISALKKLGFYAVSETALGADFVSADIASGLRDASEKNEGQKLFLSSACPAVVLYIKRYAPDFVPFLNDRASPLLAHATLLRKMYGNDIRIVFIGPCIAKKREADQFKEINAALTYNELRQWFKEEGIRPEYVDEDESAGQSFVPRRAAKGSFYPVDGGMLISLRAHSGFSKTSNMVISGIDTIAEMLNRDTSAYEQLESPLFLELLACQGGCVNGPCITKDASAISRRAKLLKYAESSDDILDEETAGIKTTLTGTLTATERPQNEYSKGEIRVALSHIGKYSEKDEVNCSICGYKTCRDFAAALLEKRVEKTMCVTYTRNL
ncbi:MAG: 4Fe-4S binding protein, partial [Spirochaetaceae bacterium]|nr:4Fe-4S binding protein [Spirochaetaceae bacterium]